MSHENLNNLQPWKNKLEELKALGDHGLDKGASWGKLYERLNEKGSVKNWRAYWIGAACIAFVLIVSILFSHIAPDKIINPVIKPSPAETEKTVANASEKRNETKRADAVLIGKTAIPADKKAAGRTRKFFRAEGLLRIQVSDTVDRQKSPLVKVEDSVNTEQLSPDLAVRKPEKKKLRVVHVNELGEPLEELTGVEHNISGHYFRIRFADQEVYTNPQISNRLEVTSLKINTPVNQ